MVKHLLCLGVHQEIADRVAIAVRGAGYTGTWIVMPEESEDNNQKVVDALQRESFDAMVVGGGINNNAKWLSRLRQLAQEYAPDMKIVLPDGPTAVMFSIKEAVGEP